MDEEDEREFFEERAAVLEYCGGHSRAEAERLAGEELEKRRRCLGCQRPVARDEVQGDGRVEIHAVSKRRAFELARQFRGSQEGNR